MEFILVFPEIKHTILLGKMALPPGILHGKETQNQVTGLR